MSDKNELQGRGWGVADPEAIFRLPYYCHAAVERGALHFSQCERPGRIEHGENRYCWQHDPRREEAAKP